MKKIIALISVGIFNTLHASIHIIQFIQSMLLLSTNIETHENESLIESILHNPILNIIWAIVGIFTLYLGVKDYLHHRKCKH